MGPAKIHEKYCSSENKLEGCCRKKSSVGEQVWKWKLV